MTPPYAAWLPRYPVVCACATAILLVAGGLVTSTGSGLAVPDWPLSFGGVFPPMEGGLLFGHGHRLCAAHARLLTPRLGGWVRRQETRSLGRQPASSGVGTVAPLGGPGRLAG